MRTHKIDVLGVNGYSGSGKSAVIALLQPIFPDHDHYSTGDAVRKMAEEEEIDIDNYNQYLLKNGRSFDEIVDGHLRDINTSGSKTLVDSRLGALFMPDAFNVLLKVDQRLAAERRLKYLQEKDWETYKDHTVEMVLEKIVLRDGENDDRYALKYPGFRILDETKYDLVIENTEFMTLQGIVDIIVPAYKAWRGEEVPV